MKFFNYKSLEVLVDNAYKFKEYGLDIDLEAINIIKEKFDKKEYRVSVLGADGSGKSTLINTILLNKSIKVLDDDKPYIRFDVANGIGSDETIALLENNDSSLVSIDSEIKRADYIIYMMNCLAYKNSENIKILQRIKELRLDILENNNIVFIANNIDLLEKQNDIVDITDDMTTLLKGIGFNDIGILPYCAKKAFLYKLIKEDADVNIYDEKSDILSKIFSVGTDRDYKSLSKNEILNILYKESNIEIFENIILKQLYERRDELLIESLSGYEKIVLKRFIEKAGPVIQGEVDKFNLKTDIEVKLLKDAERIERVRDEFEAIKEENNILLRVLSDDELKERYFKLDKFDVDSNSIEKSTGLCSAYSAIEEGKLSFKKWRNSIAYNLESIDKHYNEIQRLGTNDDSIYYFIKTRVKNNIKKLEYLQTQLEKFVDKKLHLNIDTKFMLNIKHMMIVNQETKVAFTKRVYTNDHFIGYITREVMVESTFGLRKKVVYDSDLKKAVEEEIKDVTRIREKYSKMLFDDFSIKYKEFISELTKIAKFEEGKILRVIEVLEQDVKSKLDYEDAKRPTVIREKLLDLANIYSYLENEVRGLELINI